MPSMKTLTRWLGIAMILWGLCYGGFWVWRATAGVGAGFIALAHIVISVLVLGGGGVFITRANRLE